MRRRSRAKIKVLLTGFLVVVAIPTRAHSEGGAWLVSDAGDGAWQKINASCIRQSRLRGADFNGNGKTDVVTSWDGKWRVSWDGVSRWQDLNTSDVDISDLRFADFDGDGKADVFTTWSGRWRVSFGGDTEWKVINKSDVEVPNLRFGNFDGNSKTDVFTEWGGQWRVSIDGTKPWKIIEVTKPPGVADPGVSGLVSGNYVGDKRADRLKTDLSNCMEQSETCTVSVIVRNAKCLNSDGSPSTGILEPGKTSTFGCGGSVERARTRAQQSFRSFACVTPGAEPAPGCCTLDEEVVQGCLCK
jgi:hypothetical protein